MIMARHLSNMDQLQAALIPSMVKMMDVLAERVYETLNYFLQEYYNSYDPVSYRRQYDFLRSAVKVEPKIKGNKVYSLETVAFVPHAINTLFLNGRKNRGDLPLGVHLDKGKGKYRAEMSFMGQPIKLGWFDTAESAFARYKEYKEDFICDLAEQYRDVIPYKVYEAMMNWKIEIDD